MLTRLLLALIDNAGLEAVKMEGYQMYDSGDPVSWLKSQIDHSLRRGDLGGEFRNWVRNLLNGTQE